MLNLRRCVSVGNLYATETPILHLNRKFDPQIQSKFDRLTLASPSYKLLTIFGIVASASRGRLCIEVWGSRFRVGWPFCS